MAEIFGVIASVVGVSSAGIKLSIALFDLGDRIGSAGDEVKLVATDLSLFCSTLQALKSALEDTEHIHCTPAAYQLVERVVQECQTTIAELEKIVNSLSREQEGLSDFPSLEWTSRVKWTFKRSRVQLHRQTLESCKSTLHLLLSTLRWSRRTSVPKAVTVDPLNETEQYQMVTQGLVLAVRTAVNQLRTAETAANTEKDSSSDDKRVSQLLNGLSLQTSKPQSEQLKPRRASTWLDKLVFDEEPDDVAHPGQRQRQQRFSSATTTNDPFLLLRKWTESRPQRTMPAQEASSEEVFGSFKFKPSLSDDKMTNGKPASMRATTILISPRSSLANNTFQRPALPPIRHAGIELNCQDQLPAASAAQWLTMMLTQLGIPNQHEGWELVIMFGGNEQILQCSDQPDTIMKDLSRYNLNPRLVVRQRRSVGGSLMYSSPTHVD